MPVPFLGRGDTAACRRSGLVNKSQEFWKALQGVLTDEGYTSNETFCKVVETVRDMRNAGLESLEGDERDRFEVETHWVAELDGKQ